MPNDTASRPSSPLALLAFVIGCLHICATSSHAQDIDEVVVLPAAPNTPVVVPAMPDTPIVVPSTTSTAVVIVPILSDYRFPRYQTDDVLTQRNDNNRSGASHVAGINQHTVARFARLGSFRVTGVVLSQPLYVQDAIVNNVRQPVLVVATSNNDVYAFSPSEHQTQPLWHTSLGRPVVSKPGDPAPPADGADCAPNALAAWQEPGTLGGLETGLVGIESTPVIDRGLGRIFVSYKTFEGLQRVAALNLNDGQHAVPPVVVPAPNQQWHRLHRNRASLLYSDGVVFVGFSSLCEGNTTRMHGSISAFDAATLKPVGRYQVTDDGTDGGGIWQGSTGIAADTQGNLYFTTGNRRLCGAVPPGELNAADKPNLANSVIRLRTERRSGVDGAPYQVMMEPADYFTPYRRTMEDCFDLDLSAAGVLLIPGTRYLGTGGKEGVFYVLDRADLGGPDNPGPLWSFNSVDTFQRSTKHKNSPDDPAHDHVHQKFQATAVRDPDGQDYLLPEWMKWPHIHGTPAFASFGVDEFMFLWGEKDKPKRYQWRDGKFDLPPLEGEPAAPPYRTERLNGMPGGMVSVNIDPSGSGLGVVLASVKICDEPQYPPCNEQQEFGALRAYDPFTMRQVWNDTGEPHKYWFAKLVPPTIANGRVFLATASGEVLIYGVP
jgi:hypothetical protein